jgi:hypothetical protein
MAHAEADPYLRPRTNGTLGLCCGGVRPLSGVSSLSEERPNYYESVSPTRTVSQINCSIGASEPAAPIGHAAPDHGASA